MILRVYMQSIVKILHIYRRYLYIYSITQDFAIMKRGKTFFNGKSDKSSTFQNFR